MVKIQNRFKEEIYRACVKSFDKDIVEVSFIDHGGEKQIPRDSIWQFPTDLLDYPKYSITFPASRSGSARPFVLIQLSLLACPMIIIGA